MILVQLRSTIACVAAVCAAASCGSEAGSEFAGGSADGGRTDPTGGGGQVSVGAGDGAAGSADSTGQPCDTVGAEQVCCASATQTCLADGEFTRWGPCVAADNSVVTCSGVSTGCTATEAKRGCTPDGGGGGSGSGGGGGGGSSDGGSVPGLCTDPSINTEPGILVGFSPALGQTVGSHGQIKVWVNDEAAPFISSGEGVDPSTGLVTTPGARTATAPDGLLWEPAIYIAPETPLNGGTPYFPTWIKGTYNHSPPTIGPSVTGATIDAIPAGANPRDKYTAEFVWDVSSMGLAPGRYTAVFVIHDGDTDRGIGCVTMTVAP